MARRHERTPMSARGAAGLATVLLACLVASSFSGCELLDRSIEVEAPLAAVGAVDLGVGDRTLRLEPCVLMRGLAPPRIQLAAPGSLEELPADKPRVYAEVEVKRDSLPIGEAREVGLAVLRLASPLEKDEDRVYRNHDLQLILESVDGGRAKGRLSGRVEDLLYGRTHEVRAKFECANALGALGDVP